MAYLPKLNPTVGGGLGGLPERTVATSQETAPVVEDRELPYFVLNVNSFPNLYVSNNELIAPTGEQVLTTVAGWSGGVANHIGISFDGKIFALGTGSSPYLKVYGKNGNTNTAYTVSGSPATSLYAVWFVSNTRFFTHTNTGQLYQYDVANNIATQTSTFATNVKNSGTTEMSDLSKDKSTFCYLNTSNDVEVYDVINGDLTNGRSFTPTSNARLCISDDGTYIATSTNNVCHIYKKDVNGDYSLVNTITSSLTNVLGQTFQPVTGNIVINNNGSFYIYPRTGDTWGTLSSMNPDPAPTNWEFEFITDNYLMSASWGSPYFGLLRTVGTTSTALNKTELFDVNLSTSDCRAFGYYEG